MESFIKSYGIPFTEFRKLCKEYDAICAGSATLYMFLKQEGVDPQFTPHNLNLWICSKNLQRYETVYSNSLTRFLESAGYVNMNKLGLTNEYRCANMGPGETIGMCKQNDGKIIYIKFINALSAHNYIMNTSLLNICSIIWRPDTDTFYNANSTSIKNKKMYICRDFRNTPDELNKWELGLVVRYKNRGFQLFTHPGFNANNKDYRVITSNSRLNSIKVFDLFAYEEYSAKEYLGHSNENILIKSGEQYHGFNRYVLIDYLISKELTLEEVGKVCLTPLNHCISSSFIMELRNRAYTIYELKERYSVVGSRSRTYNICSMLCYNIGEFENGSYYKELFPPSLKSGTFEDFKSNVEDLMVGSPPRLPTDLYINNQSITEFMIRNVL